MVHLIDLILCGATFLLAFIIFVNTNKVNTKANQWFAVFVFCVFLLLLQNILLYTKLLKADNFAFELLSLSSFVIAPFFYISVCYYVTPIRKWRILEYLHFGFAFIILVFIILSHTVVENVKTTQIDAESVSAAEMLFYICFSLQVIPYCILAYLKISRHQKNVRLLNSTVENIDLKWLKNIIITVFIIALFWVLDIVFNLSEKSTVFDLVSSLVYLLAILYITFYWLKQKEIFPYTPTQKEEIESIIVETAIPKDNRKKLVSDEKLEELKIELLAVINSQKPFLDDDLSLVKLASLLNISSHLLSYVINKGFDENFYQFINRYRIEEAKKRILDPTMSHLSLLGIGFEVGFNSKTVFNTTFKKVTGQTPSEFKRQNEGK